MPCMTCCAPTPASWPPSDDSEDERRAALTRLFDYYLHAAAAAMDTLFPAERTAGPASPPPVAPAPPVAPRRRGAGLAGRRAGEPGRRHRAHRYARLAGHAIRLAATLFRYLDPAATSRGRHHPRPRPCAAAQVGDRDAEAEALNSLGLVDMHQGRYQQATPRSSTPWR